METLVATAAASGRAEPVAEALAAELAAKLGDRAPVLVLVFAAMEQPLAQILAHVQARFSGATILGTSTAGEFTEMGDTQGAVAAWALAGDFHVEARLARGLATALERTATEATSGLGEPRAGYPHRLALILLDPRAGNAEEATLMASALLGADVRLVGGAAADNLEMQATCVGLGAEVADDAMIIAMVHARTPVGIGVCHGHVPLSGPMRVTRAERNVVYEIDGKPAWQAWTEATAARAAELGIDVEALATSGRIFEYLNRFEAGLRLGAGADDHGEYKVRVPISRSPDGALHFACGMPESTVVRVMESEHDAQIASARAAVRRSLSSLGSHAVAGALVFDCSCRKTILQDRFGDAVAAMREELGGAPLAGFETYGEIAMEVGEMSGFHNTTTVVVTFGR